MTACIKCGGDEDLMDRGMAPGMTYCRPCRVLMAERDRAGFSGSRSGPALRMTRRLTVEVFCTEDEVEGLRERLERHAEDFVYGGNAEVRIVSAPASTSGSDS
jgi:hypothetical protein